MNAFLENLKCIVAFLLAYAGFIALLILGGGLLMLMLRMV
jgi:hypothetical protein